MKKLALLTMLFVFGSGFSAFAACTEREFDQKTEQLNQQIAAYAGRHPEKMGELWSQYNRDVAPLFRPALSRDGADNADNACVVLDRWIEKTKN